MQQPSESCSIKIIHQLTIQRSPECVGQKITVRNFQNRAQILRNNEIALIETYFRITQLSIPTHAQLQRHRLKFIKNLLKNS